MSVPHTKMDVTQLSKPARMRLKDDFDQAENDWRSYYTKMK
jgi:hypothetical protein